MDRAYGWESLHTTPYWLSFQKVSGTYSINRSLWWSAALHCTNMIPCKTEWEDSPPNKAVIHLAFSSTPLKAKFTAGKLNKHYAYDDNSFLQTQVLVYRHAGTPWYSASKITALHNNYIKTNILLKEITTQKIKLTWMKLNIALNSNIAL